MVIYPENPISTVRKRDHDIFLQIHLGTQKTRSRTVPVRKLVRYLENTIVYGAQSKTGSPGFVNDIVVQTVPVRKRDLLDLSMTFSCKSTLAPGKAVLERCPFENWILLLLSLTFSCKSTWALQDLSMTFSCKRCPFKNVISWICQ